VSARHGAGGASPRFPTGALLRVAPSPLRVVQVVQLGDAGSEKLAFEAKAEVVSAWSAALSRLIAVVKQRRSYETLYGGAAFAAFSPRSVAVASPKVSRLLRERQEKLTRAKQERLLSRKQERLLAAGAPGVAATSSPASDEMLISSDEMPHADEILLHSEDEQQPAAPPPAASQQPSAAGWRQPSATVGTSWAATASWRCNGHGSGGHSSGGHSGGHSGHSSSSSSSSSSNLHRSRHSGSSLGGSRGAATIASTLDGALASATASAAAWAAFAQPSPPTAFASADAPSTAPKGGALSSTTCRDKYGGGSCSCSSNGHSDHHHHTNGHASRAAAHPAARANGLPH
jgi:hypothetical protein